MTSVSPIFDGHVARARSHFEEGYADRFRQDVPPSAVSAMLYHAGEMVRLHKAFGEQSADDVRYRLNVKAMMCAYRNVQADLENSEDLMLGTKEYADALFGVMARLSGCFGDDIQPLEDLDMDVTRLQIVHGRINFTSLALALGRLEHAPRKIEPDYLFGA